MQASFTPLNTVSQLLLRQLDRLAWHGLEGEPIASEALDGFTVAHKLGFPAGHGVCMMQS
jgi:hypothetical protein